jgi:hypothetical protein
MAKKTRHGAKLEDYGVCNGSERSDEKNIYYRKESKEKEERFRRVMECNPGKV